MSDLARKIISLLCSRRSLTSTDMLHKDQADRNRNINRGDEEMTEIFSIPEYSVSPR